MQTAMAIGGFLALLSLVTSLLAAWLVGRMSDRLAAVEREAKALAEECARLHLKLEAIPGPLASGVDPPETTTVLGTGIGPSPSHSAAPELPHYTPASVDTGMNLSKRVQILRLNRRGESAAHISSVLNLPLAQVELVLKLQRQQADPVPQLARG